MMVAVASDDRTVIDPRAEARRRLDDRFDARVLEPSPPAVAEAPWFADDPVNDAVGEGRDVVAPVPGLGTTWSDLAHADAALAQWCADRWLAAWRRLAPPPDVDALVATRRSWHALAEHVVAPARYAVTGKIGLRYTRGGFGTPYFDTDRQVRVDGVTFVVVGDGAVTRDPITSVTAAAAAAGVAPGAPADVYTPTTPFEPDAPLPVDAEAARFLGDWFGFATSVLEELRAVVPATDTPARVQLWPEHFDPSVDFGDDAAGRRATYGASPGDDGHPLPYVYVTPWTAQSGPFWNEGPYASLGLADFVGAPDQRAAVLDFFGRARDLLAAGP
jgi:hypothetical protein